MNRTCHDIHTPPPKGGVSVSVTPETTEPDLLAAAVRQRDEQMRRSA